MCFKIISNIKSIYFNCTSSFIIYNGFESKNWNDDNNDNNDEKQKDCAVVGIIANNGTEKDDSFVVILFFYGGWCDDDYNMIIDDTWKNRFGIAVCIVLERE